MTAIAAIAATVVGGLLVRPGNAKCRDGVCYPPTWRSTGNATAAVDSKGRVATCRIVNDSSSGRSLGSGALIAVVPPMGYVLTCGHLFDGGSTGVSVAFASGQRFEAAIVATDRPHDLALLRIAAPAIEPLEVGAVTTSGTAMTCCGFGGTGRFRAVSGPVIGYATATGATNPSIRIRGAVRSGDSGGPVLDAGGRLVGVVWGVRDGVTYASFGKPVQRLLARIPNGLAQGAPPATARQQPSSNKSRFAAIESRIAKLTPCRCPADAVTRSDLAPFARTTDVNAAINAIRVDVNQTPSRFGELRDQAVAKAKSAAIEAVRERLASLDLKGIAWSKTQVVLASLGVGGPIGLALLAGRLFLRSRRRRRRQSDRRGPGGPRDARFRDEAAARP